MPFRRKNISFNIVATHTQRDRWNVASELEGLTLSDWVRRVLDKAAAGSPLPPISTTLPSVPSSIADPYTQRLQPNPAVDITPPPRPLAARLNELRARPIPLPVPATPPPLEVPQQVAELPVEQAVELPAEPVVEQPEQLIPNDGDDDIARARERHQRLVAAAREQDGQPV